MPHSVRRNDTQTQIENFEKMEGLTIRANSGNWNP